MKNRKGVSLIWVIIALVFVSMMTMSIATIAQSNILQAKRQDDIKIQCLTLSYEILSYLIDRAEHLFSLLYHINFVSIYFALIL